MNNTQLQKRIMRRVYAVWVMRALVGGVALKLYTLLAFAVVSLRYISFGDVARNFMDVYKTSSSTFIYSAFANTEIMTLALLAGMILVVSWLMKDIVFTHKRLVV